MSDPGPIPDSLKRQPPTQVAAASPPTPAPQMEAVHLATPELVKAINDEYAIILGSERANLPRALVIAEKLNALRARTIRGQWKTKFYTFGLKISYETASVYLRIWENWADIKWLAVQKSVDPTLLTIDGARELWARRKDTEEDDTEDAAEGDGKPTVEAMEARQAANAEAEAAELADDDVDVDAERRQRVDRTLAVLMRTYPQDELLDLTERLAKHLGMTLMPLDTMTALAETLSLTPIDDVSANVSVGVDAE